MDTRVKPAYDDTCKTLPFIADIQMSFVGEMAKIQKRLDPYPNLSAWLSRMHARPAFQRGIEKGGAYRFAGTPLSRPCERRDP